MVGTENKNVIVIDADLAKSTYSWTFGKMFPERFFNIGIQEANMVGIAQRTREQREDPVHLELRGVHPVQGLRSAAHGRGVSEAQHEGGGLARRDLDRRGRRVAAECGGCRARVRASGLRRVRAERRAHDARSGVRGGGAQWARVSRLGRPKTFVVHDAAVQFEFGRSIELRDGHSLTIVANGLLVAQALIAADALSKRGIEARVLDMHTVKPLDSAALERGESRDGRICCRRGAHALRRAGERGGAGAGGRHAGPGGVRESRRSLRGAESPTT